MHNSFNVVYVIASSSSVCGESLLGGVCKVGVADDVKYTVAFDLIKIIIIMCS